MMRERTLKSLFPDPKPPHRKNFIKENVRSLRKMEQLFNTNNKSAKDLKLPVLKPTKVLNKHAEVGDNQNISSNEKSKELNNKEISENEFPKLVKQKSITGDQKNRKKSPFVLSNNKTASQKVLRPSINGNLRKGYYCQTQVDVKKENIDNLKAHSEENVTHQKLNEVVKNESNKSSKNQAVQTLDTNDLSNLYLEGVIRYPSIKITETKDLKTSTDDTNQLENKDSQNKTGSKCSLHDDVDYVKLNKERISIASKLASQLSNNAAQPNHRIGVVPKYIKERKETLQKEQQTKAAVKELDYPDGYVPVPDKERRKTLNVLKQNYQKFVNELNMLPIRTDTLRSQKRKMEIEKQLTKLEEGIKIFSRPKVFVNIDY